jgi:hypothetical protein
MVPPRVELLWWEGCPSWRQAAEQLRKAVSRVGLSPQDIELREIATDDDARRAGFIGSPTIRIDGEDPFPPGDQPAGLTCRVYRLRDGRVSPLPDPADLDDALGAAAGALRRRS